MANPFEVSIDLSESTEKNPYLKPNQKIAKVKVGKSLFDDDEVISDDAGLSSGLFDKEKDKSTDTSGHNVIRKVRRSLFDDEDNGDDVTTSSGLKDVENVLSFGAVDEEALAEAARYKASSLAFKEQDYDIRRTDELASSIASGSGPANKPATSTDVVVQKRYAGVVRSALDETPSAILDDDDLFGGLADNSQSADPTGLQAALAAAKADANSNAPRRGLFD